MLPSQPAALRGRWSRPHRAPRGLRRIEICGCPDPLQQRGAPPPFTVPPSPQPRRWPGPLLWLRIPMPQCAGSSGGRLRAQARPTRCGLCPRLSFAPPSLHLPSPSSRPLFAPSSFLSPHPPPLPLHGKPSDLFSFPGGAAGATSLQISLAGGLRSLLPVLPETWSPGACAGRCTVPATAPRRALHP